MSILCLWPWGKISNILWLNTVRYTSIHKLQKIILLGFKHKYSNMTYNSFLQWTDFSCAVIKINGSAFLFDLIHEDLLISRQSYFLCGKINIKSIEKKYNANQLLLSHFTFSTSLRPWKMFLLVCFCLFVFLPNARIMVNYAPAIIIARAIIAGVK